MLCRPEEPRPPAGCTDLQPSHQQGAGPGQRVPDHPAGRSHPAHRRLADRRRPRADAHGRLPPPREGDALRPRAHPRAGGPRPGRGRPRRVRGQRRPPTAITSAGFLQAGVTHAGVHPLLDRRRLARLGRHGARRPRLRHEVLHRRGQLRPRRQQHPGVLHPGRHQVPGPDPRRQARARRRDPAGADRPHDVLGLRVADPRVAAHAHVGDVGPGHPALVPDDGGLRRPHLPPRQRRRRDVAGEVPLEAAARRARPGVGGGARPSTASTPTSTAATSTTPSAPAPSRSGSSACR